MDYIVVIFHPFEIEQDVAVYQHGKCVLQEHPCLEDTIKTVCSLNKQYYIDKIDLCGNPSFVRKYVTDLKTNFSLESYPTIEIIPH